MKYQMIKRLAIMLLLASIGISAQAAPLVADDLALANATACRKPNVPSPPQVKESAERYNAQRRYIDLDGSGTCVLMDFWVERLGGSDSPGMRTPGHRFLHVVGGKWVPFETSLELFPFLLRSASTGQVYLVVAPDRDIDDMAAGGIQPAAYVRGKWETTDPTMVHTYSLRPVNQERGRIFRALATQLTQLTPSNKQTSAERERIRALEFEAAEVDKEFSPAVLP